MVKFGVNQYLFSGGKRLRMGYTTGTAAAAAAKASAEMLLSRKAISSVSIVTPKGIPVLLELKDVFLKENEACCAVVKDGGDDPDVTTGLMIYARVLLIPRPEVKIDGGEGIGRVTKPGLDQPVGNAAINSVPRRMITSELLAVAERYGYTGGFSVTISAPGGKETAEKTFNSRLGILGGISILGTSGIVEPMSDEALIQTNHLEIDQRYEEGNRLLLLTPGNYGQDFIGREYPGLEERAVKCSNFIGDSMDYAAEKGFQGMLLIGHIGKLVKLAGGMFNTHSRFGDCRGELFCAAALRQGGDVDLLKAVLCSATTDEMIDLSLQKGLKDAVMEDLGGRILEQLNRRTYGRLKAEVIVFSQKFGLLYQSGGAFDLLKKISEE
jgi:cobalt-precorrin-5B (C1)-methyltransferase